MFRLLLGRVRAADVGVGADQLPYDHRAVYTALRAGRQGPALDKDPSRYCIGTYIYNIYFIAISFFWFFIYFDIGFSKQNFNNFQSFFGVLVFYRVFSFILFSVFLFLF